MERERERHTHRTDMKEHVKISLGFLVGGFPIKVQGILTSERTEVVLGCRWVAA
jgi:hypothetical protein